MELTPQQIRDMVQKHGGKKEVDDALVTMIDAFEGQKFTDIAQAFGLYMYIEGFSKGMKVANGETW